MFVALYSSLEVFVARVVATDGAVADEETLRRREAVDALVGFGFMEVAAISDGEMLNYSNIAADCGVSAKTVKSYFQILYDTLIGYEIPAFRKEIKRKVVQAPRFYYFDVGLANYLMGRHALKRGTDDYGHAFEHFVMPGGIVITGIAKGQGDIERVKGFTSLTFFTLLVTIAILSLMVALFLRPLCFFLGSNEEAYPFVRQYLGIIGIGFIFYCIPNFTEAFTRLGGRPNMVFVSGVICCVVNVVLDYFFVIRFNWGVSGAAVATCIANTTAALVLLPNVRFGKVKGGFKEVKKMFFNGSSEMLTSVSAAVTTYIFNLVLMRKIGTKGVAAFTIVCYLNFIVNMSIFGLSQAMYPLVSFSVGVVSVPLTAVSLRQLRQRT